LNRKLLLLDVVLVAVVVYVGLQFRNEAGAAKAREAAALNRHLKALPPPPWKPMPPDPPVMPSGYVNIAEKMLFDPSRNSIVIIEPPPVPPPKPMPALPVYHGMMSLGSSGLTAFFSLSADGQHQAIHIGETIGQFKLLSVNSDEITLEWDGHEIRKTVAELSGQKGAPVVQVSQGVRTEAGPGPIAPPTPVKSGPGDLTNFNTRTCAVNDGNPAGAVVDQPDGKYKKVMHTNPFGTNCAWEPVGK
jgi:hypothetical protein